MHGVLDSLRQRAGVDTELVSVDVGSSRAVCMFLAPNIAENEIRRILSVTADMKLRSRGIRAVDDTSR